VVTVFCNPLPTVMSRKCSMRLKLPPMLYPVLFGVPRSSETDDDGRCFKLPSALLVDQGEADDVRR